MNAGTAMIFLSWMNRLTMVLNTVMNAEQKRNPLMGRVKDWLMDMEEDAYNLPYHVFIDKHGSDYKSIYESVNGQEDSFLDIVMDNKL